MSEAQTLSYTKAQAANWLRIYRTLLIASIVIDAAIGLYCLLDPVGLARLLMLPDPYPDAWARLWGATFLGLQLLFVAGARNPLFYRWTNWSSIGIKLFLTIVLLCLGAHFQLLAAWQFLLFVALFATYYQLALAALRSHP
jgi:hypothetical protein